MASSAGSRSAHEADGRHTLELGLGGQALAEGRALEQVGNGANDRRGRIDEASSAVRRASARGGPQAFSPPLSSGTPRPRQPDPVAVADIDGEDQPWAARTSGSSTDPSLEATATLRRSFGNEGAYEALLVVVGHVDRGHPEEGTQIVVYRRGQGGETEAQRLRVAG